MLSHELRAPVTSIYAAASILRSSSGTLNAQEKSDLLDAVVEESERLLRLLEHVLIASQLEQGTGLHWEPTLMQRVIPLVIDSERRQRPEPEIDLRIEPGLPVVTVCVTCIQQVVRNLISNAVKYGRGEAVEVELSSDSHRDGVVTRVLDRGDGVPSEEMDALFRPFYRSSRTVRTADGEGLGLYVCREMIEAMGGTIWIREREGGGSEFGFWVPEYPPEPEEEDADPDA